MPLLVVADPLAPLAIELVADAVPLCVGLVDDPLAVGLVARVELDVVKVANVVASTSQTKDAVWASANLATSLWPPTSVTREHKAAMSPAQSHDRNASPLGTSFGIVSSIC